MPSVNCKHLLIAVTLLVLPFFFIGGPDWTSGPLYRSVWNLGHILFFGALTLTVQLYIGRGGWRQWLGISIGVLISGIVIESLQSLAARQVGWQDLLRNLIGAWLVLAWRQPTALSSPLNRCLIWLARMGAVVLLVHQLGLVMDVALQQARVARQLPDLVDMASPETITYWSGDVEYSPKYSGSGARSLAIHLGTGRYSGASLNNLPSDWSGYRYLLFGLYNPGTSTIPLTLRINDVAHDRGANAYNDRFNTRLLANPGWNHYNIKLGKVEAAPDSRAMDMEAIRRLGIFTSALESPETVYMTDLRLSRSTDPARE